ncbi:MAG: OB-fold nucleic acid binding domain-containing protein [Nanoarchaeota archaeon]
MMMNLQYDDVIKLIKEKTSLSDEQIKKKIDDKLTQLSGLISKEGAAHIIANELGINFANVEKKLKIDKIIAGMRNVETLGKVIQKYELREFNSNGREGKVANLLLGDETGVMRVVMWNNMAEKFPNINEGDILKINSGYSRTNNNRTEIHLNEQSAITINPEGETVEGVKSRPLSERKKISELTENDENVEVMGAIVQAFDPRFFEVDSNGKRVRPASDGQFYDSEGKVITPEYSYVFNIFLDDGTENIRVVCFRNQMQSILGKGHEEIVQYRNDPSLFENEKHNLLGQMVKIRGRVVKNEMFDRLEVIAGKISIEKDPEQEIKNVQKTAETNTAQNSTQEEDSGKIENEPEKSAQDENSVGLNPEPQTENNNTSQDNDSFNSGNEFGSTENKGETDSYRTEESSEDKKREQEASNKTESDIDELGELEELDELDESEDL